MGLSGTKVLLTGADGFIGSHLTEALVREGAEVRAMVLYNSFSSWGWLDRIPSEVRDAIEVFAGDVRDPNGVREAVRGRDTVMHLAALIGIPYSYHSPDSYVDTNVRGTLNVLQASRDHGVGRVLVTSTSEVYGTALRAPIDESHPLQAQSPYSATKIGADAIADAFFRAFGTPVVTVRPFNTYGPRQSARAFIPTIVTQLLEGRERLELGSLTPTRDLTYVSDTASGFIALAGCESAVGRVVNLGTGTEVSVGDVASRLVEMIAPGTPVVLDQTRVRPEASEVERLVADVSLVRELTGWRHMVALDEGLSRTVEWFRDPANRAGYKAGIYNV